ncbi:MAG: hypothetical protein FWB85_05210 [Chitinispirillia bacterium]|nr:hypothetical protein [Chitinispirillia bacterium]
MSRNHFQHVGGLKPRRNVFDLSYRKNFTCDMGQLVPIMCDEVVPGDHLKIGNQVVIRFQPLSAPIMHEITATVHYFFCPNRILWKDWEKFIVQGMLDGVTPLDYEIPRFMPTWNNGMWRNCGLGTLWDYFGLPVPQAQRPGELGIDFVVTPIDMPWRAYNRVFNEYYRDQDLQTIIGDGETEDEFGNILSVNPYVLNRNWRKDYFTSARPRRQKGTPPALPAHLDLTSGLFSWDALPPSFPDGRIQLGRLSGNGGGTMPVIKDFSMKNNVNIQGSAREDAWALTFSRGLAGDASFTGPVIDTNDVGARVAKGLRLDSAGAELTTFDVSDLRLTVQLQKWLERNSRAGTRYTEFLRAHFGVSPTDARLDRPEYIGGTKMPVQISEIVQNSETATTPQGQMTGHGLAADGSYAGSYFVQEYGIIIGILSVMPKPSYQNGINRQWSRRLPTDFYFAEFAHLSEQMIEQSEIFAGFGWSDDHTPFGYAGMYDEMRVKNDMVCGEMRVLAGRPDLSYWNMTRSFDHEAIPKLNSEFITCNPRKDIFLVQEVTDPETNAKYSVPGLIVNVQNIIKATRPLPIIAEPGMMDHF